MAPEKTDRKWYHLAVCQGMDVRWFYDDYEFDPVFAEVMDGICASCPVRELCYAEGVANGEYGLWGGVFLSNGKVDKSRNAHKTDEVRAAFGMGKSDG